jgi:hypothetical protein
MARKRASLAGRGVEILFGEQLEQEEDQEAAAEGAVDEQPSADAGEDMEASWAAMLEAEAETATVEDEDAVPAEPAEAIESPTFSAEDGRPDWPAVEVETPSKEVIPPAEKPLPDLATTPVGPEEALPPLATTPVEAVETPATRYPASTTIGGEGMSHESPRTTGGWSYQPETPPAPMYTEPHVEPTTMPTAPLPPPRDKPEAYDPVVRAQVTGMLYQSPTEKPPEERLLPDGPDSSAIEIRDVGEFDLGQPSRIRDEREVMDYVGLKQRQVLWQEITELYKEVPNVLSTDELHDEALELLRAAQDILMEKPRQFDVAQYKVGQVRTIVVRRKNTTKWTNTYGWGTFFYEVIWLIALLAAILFAPYVVTWIEGIVGTTTSFVSVADLWNTAAWGSIGGVTGALYSLYWHAAKVKDFDKQYMMWYIVQPVIGVIIGAAIYVLIGAGLINLIGQTASGEQTPLELFPYAIAWVAGFRQRFILEVVDRFIQFLTTGGQQQTSTPTSAPAQPPEGDNG